MQEQKKASITLSLHQEIEREAQNIEKEMAKHPELDDIHVTEEMDKALMEKIRAYEKELEEERRAAKKAGEDSRELRDGFSGDAGADGFAGSTGSGMKDVEFSDELVPDLTERIVLLRGKEQKCAGEDAGEKVVYRYRRKKRKYLVVSLVAVLLIVFGAGMNSVGSKSYWKMIREIFIDDGPMNVINVEDMEEQNTEDVEEVVAYRDIKEKFNINLVRLFYKPNDMELINYEIHEEIQTAQLLYNYQGEIIRYVFYISDVDSSWGQTEEDNKINEYRLSVNEIEIKVEEFEVKNASKNRQSASFEYQGVHYQLSGVMEKTDFENILKNLYFF